MILYLARDCPLFLPANEIHLHTALRTVVREWHVIASPDPDALKSMLSSHIWDLYGAIIQATYVHAANSSMRPFMPGNCHSCQPERIASYLNLPVRILVENPRSDGGFIQMTVDAIRPRLRRSFSGNAQSIEIMHGGGIGEVAEEIGRLTRDRSGMLLNDMPPRLIVLVDSDADRPGHRSSSASRVADAARSHGVDVHLLRKRSIENYIPDEALLEYGQKRRDRLDAVDLILGLSPTQRDHYPMKDGIPPGPLPTGSLFPDSTPRQVGLGNFFNDFLDQSVRHVTAKGLSDRDGVNELDSLLDTIERNI